MISSGGHLRCWFTSLNDETPNKIGYDLYQTKDKLLGNKVVRSERSILLEAFCLYLFVLSLPVSSAEASISFRNLLVRSRTSKSFDTALRSSDCERMWKVLFTKCHIEGWEEFAWKLQCNTNLQKRDGDMVTSKVRLCACPPSSNDRFFGVLRRFRDIAMNSRMLSNASLEAARLAEAQAQACQEAGHTWT